MKNSKDGKKNVARCCALGYCLENFIEKDRTIIVEPHFSKEHGQKRHHWCVKDKKTEKLLYTISDREDRQFGIIEDKKNNKRIELVINDLEWAYSFHIRPERKICGNPI